MASRAAVGRRKILYTNFSMDEGKMRDPRLLAFVRQAHRQCLAQPKPLDAGLWQDCTERVISCKSAPHAL